MDSKIVIFDMDGTLQDSSVTIANAINHVRGRLSLEPMPISEIISGINDPSINPAEYFYETEHFEPIHEEWFSEYYSANHERELRLYPGIEELLKRLRDRGVMLAVATNAYRRSTIESLKHLGIYGYFDLIVCYDDVERGKPAPDMLLAILHSAGVSASQALFVGDGVKDRMASEAAGVEFVKAGWGYDGYEDALGSVDELADYIDEWVKRR
jgi:phosphoglycolate phosphatase